MSKAKLSAVKFFRVTSYITGTFLMLLVIEMVFRYGFGYDFYAFGPNGLVTLELRSVEGENVALETGFNLSTWILIVHGWLYVLYLFGDFRLWTLMRWSFLRFLIIAAGGVVPMLSFFTERYYSKVAKAQIKGENN
jgi:integral membrane protein